MTRNDSCNEPATHRTSHTPQPDPATRSRRGGLRLVWTLTLHCINVQPAALPTRTRSAAHALIARTRTCHVTPPTPLRHHHAVIECFDGEASPSPAFRCPSKSRAAQQRPCASEQVGRVDLFLEHLLTYLLTYLLNLLTHLLAYLLT